MTACIDGAAARWAAPRLPAWTSSTPATSCSDSHATQPSSSRAVRPRGWMRLTSDEASHGGLPACLPACLLRDAPACVSVYSGVAGCVGESAAVCVRARTQALRFQPTGVREAWLQSRELSQFSADELLARQLNSGTFVNEHLQPSSYRFSGRTGLGTPLRMDMVGKVESITVDMRRIATEHCKRLREEDARRCAASPAEATCASRPACPLDAVAAAVGKLWQNRHPDLEARSGALLSRRGLQRFCLSEVYQADAELYGYDCLDRPANAEAKAKAEPGPAPEIEAAGAAEQRGWPVAAAAEVESGMGPVPPSRRDSAFAGAFAGLGGSSRSRAGADMPEHRAGAS